MSNKRSAKFSQILESARSREGPSEGDTMIVLSHLAQMRLFMLRQGLEFYPKQDTYGFRKKFLQRIIIENEIDARMEGIVDDFLIDGKGLFYFRPVRDTYRIMWFNRDNYRAYYDSMGELEEIDLIYSFRSRTPNLGAMGVPGETGKQQFVRLRIRRDLIEETISNEKPSFDGSQSQAPVMPTLPRIVRNSLGFIPAVEAFNQMRSTGMDSTGDFDWLEKHILVHDDLSKSIKDNIVFYGNPTLISSRPRQDLVESAGTSEPVRPTIASQAGFASPSNPSTRWGQPGTGFGTMGLKVPRLISNLENTDRVAYITPNAVSGDQNLYARQYREEIRTALGGVDELGISSGATAYEIKSLFGRAATTALRKCRGLITYGICKLFSLMIYHEERVFRESFGQMVGIEPPIAPIKENFEDQEEYETAVDEYNSFYAEYQGEVDQAIQEALEEQELPDGVMGLIPDGDREVEWRWRGPVFEDSTEDILNSSIVVRNLQELGVNSIEALRYLFPDKTDEERSTMLSGYPFRMAQATQNSIGVFLSLVRELQQTPHPQAPDLPLLADARLDITPYLYRAFDFLKRELTYAGQYDDGSSGPGSPAELTPIQRARANAGLPVAAPGTERPDFLPDESGAAALLPGYGFDGGAANPAAAGQSMAAGLRKPDRQFERDAAIPAPGALLASDPTGGIYPGALALGNSGAPTGPGPFGAMANAFSLPVGSATGDGADDTGSALQQRRDRAKQRRVSRKRK